MEHSVKPQQKSGEPEEEVTSRVEGPLCRQGLGRGGGPGFSHADQGPPT